MSGTAGRKVLLTGASGFVGQHVMQAASKGVFGGYDLLVPPAGWDLRDAAAVASLLRDSSPAAVIHLAAQSFVPRSFHDPAETLAINTIGTANIIKGLQDIEFEGRMLYVSSGDIYGAVQDEELPVDENTIPHPRNPYAVSKWAAEQLCLQAQRIGRLDCVIARPFNHIGPGQDENFVLPALASQIVAIERGEREAYIEAGDIDSTRDFSDVRDVVAAYAALLEDGVSGRTYIVSSGVERKVRDLLAMMLGESGVSATVRQDPARMRPSEQRRMWADSRRLTEDTGWQPRIDIKETISDIIDYARKRKQ